MEIVEQGNKLRLNVMDVASKFVTSTMDNVTQTNEVEHEVFNAHIEALENQMDRLLHQRQPEEKQKWCKSIHLSSHTMEFSCIYGAPKSVANIENRDMAR